MHSPEIFRLPRVWWGCSRPMHAPCQVSVLLDSPQLTFQSFELGCHRELLLLEAAPHVHHLCFSVLSLIKGIKLHTPYIYSQVAESSCRVTWSANLSSLNCH